MSRFIKVLSNELIKIEEYKNPKVCFNDTTYDDIANYCVLRETINPFQIFYENKVLQQRIDKAIEYCEKELNDGRSLENQWLMGCYDTCKDLLDVLKGSDKE